MLNQAVFLLPARSILSWWAFLCFLELANGTGRMPYLCNRLMHGSMPSLFKSGCAYLLQSLRCYSKAVGLALRRAAAGRAAAASRLASHLAKRLCFAATGRRYAASLRASSAGLSPVMSFPCCGSTGLPSCQRSAGGRLRRACLCRILHRTNIA